MQTIDSFWKLLQLAYEWNHALECRTSRAHVVLSMSRIFGSPQAGYLKVFPFKDAWFSRKFIRFDCTVYMIARTKQSMYASCFLCFKWKWLLSLTCYNKFEMIFMFCDSKFAFRQRRWRDLFTRKPWANHNIECSDQCNVSHGSEFLAMENVAWPTTVTIVPVFSWTKWGFSREKILAYSAVVFQSGGCLSPFAAVVAKRYKTMLWRAELHLNISTHPQRNSSLKFA